MAMIKCPECGQEISDQATTCPHCGVQIFVCPECGQVGLGKGPCKSCGYVVPTENENKTSDSDKTEKKKNLFERWNENVPEEKTKNTIFKVISAVLIAIPLVYGLVWFFQSFDNYINVTPEKYLRAVASYSSDVAQIDTLFYMSVFMSIIIPGIIDVLVDFFSKYNFAKWIRSNHIDISQEINSAISRSTPKNEKKDDDEGFSLNRTIKEANEETNIEKTDSACYMATNPNKAYLLAVIQFISKISFWVLEIFLERWGTNLLISYMHSTVMGKFETNNNGTMTFIKNFKIEWWPSVL